MNRTLTQFEPALALPADGVFDASEVADLPEPVARYFRTAIAPGTPLARTARIAMRGRIKLNRWVGFRGGEVISPTEGFVWAVRTGPISGFDCYVDGRGEMRWKIFGLVPVMTAEGPDITRSAAGRAAGEGVWIPTALLPRFGTRWHALDDSHIVSVQTVGREEITCEHTLDEHGHIVMTRFDRWGDPDRTEHFGVHPFGAEHTAFATFGGLTIPVAGRAGWHFGTERWDDGVFFEYRITEVVPIDGRGSANLDP